MLVTRKRLKVKVAAPPTGFGLNASAVNDYSIAQQFINLALTARGPLKGSTSGGGPKHYLPLSDLDEHGYPTTLSNGETSYRLIWAWGNEIAPDGRARLTGNYIMTWDGSATVTVSGASNVVYGTNTITFTLNLPTFITIIVSNIAPGNHLRNLKICLTSQLAQLNAGDVFKTDFLDLFRDAKYIRFMIWNNVNGSAITSWSQRTLPDGLLKSDGVAKEYMVRLANDLHVNPWFNVPHLADDDYIEQYATLVRDSLNPDLTAHIEYSNENWNTSFPQTQWGISEPLAVGWTNYGSNYLSWYAKKAVNMAQIWKDVFSAPGSPKLKCVIGTHAVVPYVSQQVLTAPRWLANEPENYVSPASVFDELVITSYFGSSIRSNFATFNTLMDRIDRNDNPSGWTFNELSNNISANEASWAAQKAVADQYGLVLSGYEGGSHFLHEFAVANGSPASATITGNGTQSSFTFALETASHPRFWALSFSKWDTINSVSLPFQEGVHYTYSGTVSGGTITFLGGNLQAGHQVSVSRNLTPAALTQWISFGTAFSYGTDMGALYQQAIGAWQRVTREPFPEFTDIGQPGRYGAWSMYRFVGDSTPRSQAIIAGTRLSGVSGGYAPPVATSGLLDIDGTGLLDIDGQQLGP